MTATLRCIACGYRLDYDADDFSAVLAAVPTFKAHLCAELAADTSRSAAPQPPRTEGARQCHPSTGSRLGTTAASGLPRPATAGDASPFACAQPDAAPSFRWIGERGARPLRWVWR